MQTKSKSFKASCMQIPEYLRDLFNDLKMDLNTTALKCIKRV